MNVLRKFRMDTKLPGQLIFILFTLMGLAQPAAAALYTNTYGDVMTNSSNCDDCYDGPISFGGGQTINFFGTAYGELYVGSNGYVTFGGGSTGFVPSPLDVQTLNPMIAGLFTDLDSRSDAASVVYANTTTPGQIIITYVMLGHYAVNYTVRATFQLVVRSDSFAIPPGESQIGFFYDTITDGSIASGGFGDGLVESNPGEVALFSQVAGTTQSNAAARWFSISGGIPQGPGGPVTPVPTLPDYILALLAGVILVTGLFAARRQKLMA